MTAHATSARFMPDAAIFSCVMPLVLLLGFLALFSTAAYARHFSRATVSGQLTTPQGQSVEFATMVLLKADSPLVRSAVTDSAGHYAFAGVVPGTYRVAATLVGYKKTVSPPLTIGPDQLTAVVPVLYLRENRRTLGEITVVAQKPFIENLPDKTVLNVENSLVAAGSTALDVLERAPGVLVDRQNDRITLKGREGTLVLIDGKPTYLSAQEVVNLLRNTPSNSIETMELISNPSAKYDAAGTAGIINIRFKRGSRAGGTNGSATLGGGYGRFPKATAGLTLNHRAGRLSLFGHYTYDQRESYGTIDARRQFGSGDSLTTVTIFGYRPNIARNHTIRAGADYTLGERTTMGLLLNGLLSDNFAQIDNRNDVLTSRAPVRQTNTLTNTSTRALRRLSANASLKHAFDAANRDGGARELTVDLDLSRVTIQPQDDMLTRYLDAAGQEAQPPLVQRNRAPSAINIRAAKIDYVHPLGRGLKLEAGGKLSYVTSDNDLRFETRTETGYVPDLSRTNQFLYDEIIAAGYVNTTRERSNWVVQGGLRAEHTRSVGTSVTLHKTVDRGYVNLFPSVLSPTTPAPAISGGPPTAVASTDPITRTSTPFFTSWTRIPTAKETRCSGHSIPTRCRLATRIKMKQA